MGQKRRPFDPDMKNPLESEENARLKPLFNPIPDQWRIGSYCLMGGTSVIVEVWCEYHRDKEAWVPVVVGGWMALLRTSEDVNFADVTRVFVSQEEQND